MKTQSYDHANAKAFDCVDHHKLENSERDGHTRPPDLPLEKPVCKSGSNSLNWTWDNRLVQLGKGVLQGCILSPCSFNLNEEYIMRNAGLGEAQAVIKIAGINIHNLRYADDTTVMAKREELKSILMKMKEESENVGLNLNIQITKIMESGPNTSWQIDRETVETVAGFNLGGSKITAHGDCSHEIKDAYSLEGKL